MAFDRHIGIDPNYDLPAPVRSRMAQNFGNTATVEGAALAAAFAVAINGRLYITADGTTDDTTGLNNAIAAAMSTGKELVLPPGVIITAGVSITPTANVKIRGSGMGRTILRLVNAATPIHLLRVASGAAFRVELSDLTLDGNNTLQSTDVLSALLKLESRAAGETLVHHVELKNATKTGLIAYNSAVKLIDSWVHDVVLEGVTPFANYNTEITGNLIENCTRNGIRVGSSASTTKYDGVLTIIANNRIRNITDAFAGTGQYGNGILVYRVADVIVSGNTIANVAWSFIRANRADNVVIAGNIGAINTNQQGIFVEFNTCYAAVVGNKITSQEGITVTNVDQGTFESTITGNIVKCIGPAGSRNGIRCESGIVTGNVIDGGGNIRYGISQIGGGTSVKTQLTVTGNHISGCKYAVGVPASQTGVESWAEVAGNKVTRKDANWSSFFGAIGGSEADAGNGSLIGAAYAAKVYIDQPTEDVAAGAQPPAARPGSRLSIGGVFKTWNGTAWV